jgi:hypothetical protein
LFLAAIAIVGPLRCRRRIPADTTGNPIPAGSVPYVYRMGKYEISRKMIENANAEGGLCLR